MTLLAIDVKLGDYEWTAETPQETLGVQPPAPAQPATESISADELGRRMKAYVESLLSDPNWRAEQERKQAEKAERRKAREERLAARRQRKAA